MTVAACQLSSINEYCIVLYRFMLDVLYVFPIMRWDVDGENVEIIKEKFSEEDCIENGWAKLRNGASHTYTLCWMGGRYQEQHQPSLIHWTPMV